MIRKIGETFLLIGHRIRVVESSEPDSCEGCIFNDDHSVCDALAENIIGSCGDLDRGDERGVIFVSDDPECGSPEKMALSLVEAGKEHIVKGIVDKTIDDAEYFGASLARFARGFYDELNEKKKEEH